MDLRAKLQQWLTDGWTDSETPLDGYGRAIVEEVLALAAGASEEPQPVKESMGLSGYVMFGPEYCAYCHDEPCTCPSASAPPAAQEPEKET